MLPNLGACFLNLGALQRVRSRGRRGRSTHQHSDNRAGRTWMDKSARKSSRSSRKRPQKILYIRDSLSHAHAGCAHTSHDSAKDSKGHTRGHTRTHTRTRGANALEIGASAPAASARGSPDVAGGPDESSSVLSAMSCPTRRARRELCF